MRGRIRSIKPEVHTDEDLWDLEELVQMPIFRVFTGLWNYSDREGLFEWRPRALKALILPYWDGDFGAAMDALAAAGFVLRYEVDGRAYGKVRTFKKHQVVNNREEPSTLPPPPEPRVEDASGTRGARVEHAGRDAGRDAGQGEGKGKEGKGKEGSTRAERVGPGLAKAHPEPSRLRAHLEECVRAEFGKYEEPSQKAANSQWISACERLQEALNLRKFPGAEAACEALASAAVAEARKPGGRDLGFALQRVQFVPGRVVPLGVAVRGLDAAEDV